MIAPAIRKDDAAKHLDKLRIDGDGARFRIVVLRKIDGKDSIRHFDWQMAIPRREVAMRAEPRCAQCDSEAPKIICLRHPAGERYCGRDCLYKGQENFIRWLSRANAEAAS